MVTFKKAGPPSLLHQRKNLDAVFSLPMGLIPGILGGHTTFLVSGVPWSRLNYAPNKASVYVRLPFSDLDGSQWCLVDQMKEVAYEREGSDLKARGLYLDTSPWETSVFALTKRT